MGTVTDRVARDGGRDALQRRQADILQAILLVVALSLLAVAIIGALRGATTGAYTDVALNLTWAGLVLGVIAVLRLGRLQAATVLFVALLVLGFGQGLAAAAPEDRGPYLALLMVPVAVAGLLLPRAALWLTAVAVVLVAQLAQGLSVLSLGNVFFATLFLAVVVDQFGGTVRQALVDAIAHEQALEASRADLTTRTSELQAAVASLQLEIGRRRELEAERAAMHERMVQNQRLESIGRLAGGVAHDFNNLLTAIRGYADLLALHLPPDDREGQDDVDAIRHASDQAASLTRQLLAFSRNQELRPTVVDLGDVIRGVEPLLRRLLGERVRLVVKPIGGLWPVLADQGQLESVLVNLAVNARDAMPDGGRLTIESANVELDNDYARIHAEVVPGPHAMVAVSDTGVGMDAETLGHIFEPFFTTKGRGKGTGLGLATVYGTVRQSGGHVWVYSEPGRGTTFKVYLPRTDQAVDVPAAAVVQPPRTARETILVAEDEDAVREMVVSFLERRGYPVVAVRTGEAALEAIHHDPSGIALLLTDVVMPGIGGFELVAEARRERPEIRALVTSGYTPLSLQQEPVPDDVLFLEKPFSLARLEDAIHEVLGD